ncbi:hypothetical protein BG003_003048, partial [Podila horticola]
MCFFRKTTSSRSNSGPKARRTRRTTIHKEQEEHISPNVPSAIGGTSALSTVEAVPIPRPSAGLSELFSVDVLVSATVEATSAPDNIGIASAPSNVQTITAPCTVETNIASCTVKAIKASSFVEETLGPIMTIHLEPVDSTSEDFAKYRQLMGLNLQRLYRIEYNDNDRGNVSGQEWSQVKFFHGTRHCGCIDQDVNKTLSHKLDVTSWCESEDCAVGGILRNGHLLRFSP